MSLMGLCVPSRGAPNNYRPLLPGDLPTLAQIQRINNWTSYHAAAERLRHPSGRVLASSYSIQRHVQKLGRALLEAASRAEDWTA